MKFDVRAIFYYSSLISKSTEGRIGIYSHVTGFARRWQSKRRLVDEIEVLVRKLLLDWQITKPFTVPRGCITATGCIGDLHVWKFTSNYGASVVWNVVLNEIICHLSHGRLGRFCEKLG